MKCQKCGKKQEIIGYDGDSNMVAYGCKCDSKEGGMKYDEGKLRYSLIPPVATEALAEVLTYGAKKYAPDSWQTVPNGNTRYMDALMRHLEAYRAGEVYDRESGIHHLAHILANASFLLHLSGVVIRNTHND